MTDKKRKYEKKRRAELEAETRRRITESAVTLHGSVGPSRTSISAVAEHAGVRRSTVYRHFPDEAALFDACSSHWAAANPLPDLGRWAAIEDPDERLRAALGEMYDFYGRTERMLDNLFRDEETVASVRRTFSAYRAYIAAAADTLMSGRYVRGRGRARVQAAIGHALAFRTWQSLVREQEMERSPAVDLMCRLVAAAGSGGSAGAAASAGLARRAPARAPRR